MKIITRSVSEWSEELQRYVTVEEESSEYDGPVARCDMGGGKPPPPPAPLMSANDQNRQNRVAADYNAALNRVNTYTPFGSQTFDITGYDRRTGAPMYEQNIELSPEQQALYDQQMRGQWALGQTAQSMMGGSNGLEGFKHIYGQPMDTSGLPQLQGGPNMSGAPQVQSGFSFGGPQMSFQGVNPQMQLNTSGLPGLPGANDLAGFRQQSQDALYNRNTEYLDPQFQRGEDSLRTRLANQGIVEGSEAYQNAMQDFNRGKETAYRQARNEAIAGGGAEAERMFGIGSQARGQMYGEALGSGQFANQAAGQASDLALAQGNFANQATGQQFAQNLAGADFSNQARQQMLAEQLAGGQFTNQARAQGLQEQSFLRNQPLNEYRALMAGGDINLPQFQPMAQPGVATTDILGSINQQYQGNLDAYNARTQSKNNLMSGLASLGSAAIFMSDERVKENIEPVGELNDGTGLYLFNYKGSNTPSVGVMAQEVEQRDPKAIHERGGIKHVDYARVLAKALEAA